MNTWTQAFEWNRASAEPAGRAAARVEHHYFAFLSYSHRDTADADWLHEQLESFRVTSSLAGKLTANGVIPKRLTPIFRDRHELAASQDLGGEIRQALAASRCLIVLCSPAAAKSKWVNAEIIMFKRLHPEGCIIAAIIAGEPLAAHIPGSQSEDCFPPALRQKYDRRGRPTGKRAEPLAADLREGKGGRRMGVLKVVAGILGVGLDDLVQRNEVRRHRRMATITAASLVGMLVAIALAVTAIQARDSARDQRREAEGLVAFMVGDLKDKLEPIGRLDALDGVGSRVLSYYSKQDTSELSDAALMQRSKALSLVAQVADSRGDLDEAQRLYREAMQGTGEAVSRDPTDPQRLYDHAQNVFWIGDIARRQGRMKEAEAGYREYKRLADQLVALEPDNLRFRMEGAYGNIDMGIIYQAQRRFPEATRNFEAALRTSESVASVDPDNMEYQQALANLLGWLADSKRDQGDIAGAIRIRQRQIDFLRQLIAGGAVDVDLRERLIPAYQGLGMLLSVTSNPESSVAELRLAAQVADRLMAVEPENTRWRGYGAQAHLALADALITFHRNSEAGAEARIGCALATQVLSRDPGPSWRDLRTNCFAHRARLALNSGAPAQALTLAEQSLASARTQRDSDPSADRYAIGNAYLLLGDARRNSGDLKGASTVWAEALAQLPENVAERPFEMSERAGLLSRLGRDDEAGEITERLNRMGYRRTI